MEIEYNTKDGKGNDILKIVKIKEFPLYNHENKKTKINRVMR